MKMKKADIIMIGFIVVVAISGLFLALKFRPEKQQADWGKTFATTIQNSEEYDNVCVITICCNTILNHSDKLNPPKKSYVPENGIILEKTEVGFEEGETVFDILCRICEDTEIQLEYSWTPVYDSYYVEGINQIYEFDCGGQSGWMYKVNGHFPNYGCSGYEVSPKDEIEWIYTCEGFGTDVGAALGE